jgi:hypothetical protein
MPVPPLVVERHDATVAPPWNRVLVELGSPPRVELSIETAASVDLAQPGGDVWRTGARMRPQG